jgi:hypothetical protein
MSDERNYIAAAGYATIGIIMLALAGYCLSPDSMSLENVNFFRLIGGFGIGILASLYLLRFYNDGFNSMIMLVAGILFIVCMMAGVSSNRSFMMIIMVIGYALLALWSFLSTKGLKLVTIGMALISLNLLVRYILGTAADGTCVLAGIIDLIACAIFIYLGVAIVSEKYQLPIV